MVNNRDAWGSFCISIGVPCQEMWQVVLLAGTLGHLKTAIIGARRMGQWADPLGVMVQILIWSPGICDGPPVVLVPGRRRPVIAKAPGSGREAASIYKVESY